MPDLNGQTAFITGGAGGIGRAIATALANQRVNVVVADLDPSVDEVAQEIAAQTRGTVLGLRLDVSDAEQVEAAFAEVVRRFGALHILGNLAGIFQRLSVLEMTPPQWDRTINVNLRSVFVCTHLALPIMVRQGYGRIVSMASGIGVVGGAKSSAYAVSKAGVMVFTKSVAAEVYDQGIRVNCLAPGVTDTPMLRGATSPAETAAIVERSGRPLGTPEDVVGPFLFLVSDAGSTVSGVTLWMRNP